MLEKKIKYQEKRRYNMENAFEKQFENIRKIVSDLEGKNRRLKKALLKTLEQINDLDGPEFGIIEKSGVMDTIEMALKGE